MTGTTGVLRTECRTDFAWWVDQDFVREVTSKQRTGKGSQGLCASVARSGKIPVKNRR